MIEKKIEIVTRVAHGKRSHIVKDKLTSTFIEYDNIESVFEYLTELYGDEPVNIENQCVLSDIVEIVNSLGTEQRQKSDGMKGWFI